MNLFSIIEGSCELAYEDGRRESLSSGWVALTEDSIKNPRVTVAPTGKRVVAHTIMLRGCSAMAMGRGLLGRYGSRLPLDPQALCLRQIDTMLARPTQTAVVPASQLTELAHDLLCTLQKSAEAHFNDEQTATLTQQAMTYLQDGRTSIQDLADSLNVSREHLSRRFKHDYGVNIADMSRRIRLRRACKLLTGNMTISAIASTVGFSSRTGFRKAFYKQYNMLPEQFRSGEATVDGQADQATE